jgi:predicted amidophosphoribosyltransferase
MNSKVEDLIKKLDPNKLQCMWCRKWVDKKDANIIPFCKQCINELSSKNIKNTKMISINEN